MKRTTVVAVLAIVAMVMSGCGGGATEASPSAPKTETMAPDPLDGTAWVLTSLEAAAGDVQLPEMERPTLAFAAGEASGSAGCNRYSGPYEVDGAAVTFGEIASTAMACADPVVDATESAYLAALGAVETFAVEGDTLTLTGEGASMVFEAGSPDALIGVTWTVVSLATEDAVASTVADAEPTLEFGEDGTVSGTDGCNRYNADYSLDGPAITIGQPMTTKMACEGEALQQQTLDFAAALGDVAAYEVAGGKLTLQKADGTIAMVATSG